MAGRDRTFTILGDSLPILPGALEFAQAFLVTAAGQRNRNAAAGRADVTALPQAMGEIAFDPQTSGGLLIAVAPECAEDLRRDIERTDPAVRIIGVVSARETSEAPAVIFV
jgi:selenide,water dikinase